MARLLLLTPYLSWPPDHGGRIRTLALFERLSGHHHVVNVSGRTRDDAPEAESKLRRRGWEVEAHPLDPSHERLGAGARIAKWGRLLSGGGSLIPRFRSPRIARAVAREARHADLVILDHIWMAAYRPELGHRPYILSTHNVESAFLTRRARTQSGLAARLTHLEAQRLARVEGQMCAGSRATVAVSERDRDRLARLSGGAGHIHVVPNGVDLGSRELLPWPSGEGPRLLYLGGYDYAPNADAARRLIEEVLPRVRAQVPQAQAILVGRDPGGALADLHRQEGVTFRGRVDDLLAEWRSSHFLVAPLRFGGGSRLKVIEAFAVGRPVITTSSGAEGLEVADQRELLLGEDSPAIAQQVLRAWTNVELRRGLIDRARALVMDRYDWVQLAEQLNSAVEEALDS